MYQIILRLEYSYSPFLRGWGLTYYKVKYNHLNRTDVIIINVCQHAKIKKHSYHLITCNQDN